MWRRWNIEGIEGGGGAEVKISGNPLGIVPGEPMVGARSGKLSHQDHGMDWELSGKSGFFSPFTYGCPIRGDFLAAGHLSRGVLRRDRGVVLMGLLSVAALGCAYMV